MHLDELKEPLVIARSSSIESPITVRHILLSVGYHQPVRNEVQCDKDKGDDRNKPSSCQWLSGWSWSG